MTTAWPPPADDAAKWRTIQLRPGRDVEVVKVREVKLWGRVVLIDEDANVLCDGCMQMLPVDQLGVPGSGHAMAVDNLRRPA
jgi:hypothetical protein